MTLESSLHLALRRCSETTQQSASGLLFDLSPVPDTGLTQPLTCNTGGAQDGLRQDAGRALCADSRCGVGGPESVAWRPELEASKRMLQAEVEAKAALEQLCQVKAALAS